jgi:uncharacterized protein (DUF169 family)
MDCAVLASRLTASLGLDQPPVTLTFLAAPPEGMAGPPREVPSACSFWRDAEQAAFYAPAAAHFRCPVGSMVMGFELPPAVQEQLGELTITARQAMLWNEAAGTAAWTSPSPITTGRPGCAALPLAIGQGRPAISFGCAGLRTFTGIGDDRLLIAVPGSFLPTVADALEQTLAANARMLAQYEDARDSLATG